MRVGVELGAWVSAQLWWVVGVLARSCQAGKLVLVRICYVARSALEPRDVGRHRGCAPSAAGRSRGRDDIVRAMPVLRGSTNRCIGRVRERRWDVGLARFVVDEIDSWGSNAVKIGRVKTSRLERWMHGTPQMVRSEDLVGLVGLIQDWFVPPTALGVVDSSVSRSG